MDLQRMVSQCAFFIVQRFLIVILMSLQMSLNELFRLQSVQYAFMVTAD